MHLSFILWEIFRCRLSDNTGSFFKILERIFFGFKTIKGVLLLLSPTFALVGDDRIPEGVKLITKWCFNCLYCPYWRIVSRGNWVGWNVKVAVSLSRCSHVLHYTEIETQKLIMDLLIKDSRQRSCLGRRSIRKKMNGKDKRRSFSGI